MKKNNPVIRTCIICRKKNDKSEFIRIVKLSENDFTIDKTGKINGRGCYVCNTLECLSNLKKTRALNRAFKTNIKEEIYDRIREESNQK